MLLHSWFRGVQFLGSVMMLNPIGSVPLPSSDDVLHDAARDASQRTCLAVLERHIDRPLQSNPSPLNPSPSHPFQPHQSAPQTIGGGLSTTFETVLTAPGITLYRQESQALPGSLHPSDHQNSPFHHLRRGFPVSEAFDDRPNRLVKTTLIYELDLRQGARLDLAGAITIDPSETEAHANAAYNTERDPHVPPRSLEDHWQAIVKAYPDRAFAAINGQFFGATPVRLAFPLKAQGEIISGGYAGAGEYDGEKRMLAINGETATIAPFPEIGQPDNPLFSEIPDVIVGLHPCADKGRDRAVGRTFAGVADRDGDGQTETVLILAASHATQIDAILILQRFGAIATVMLDGGGSTQTIALGQTYLTSSDRKPRAIPHTIGLLSNAAPIVSEAQEPTPRN